MSTTAAALALALRRERRAVLAWGLSLGVLGAALAALHPSIAEALTEVSEQYPPELMRAFGVEGLASPEGYVHAELLSFMVPFAAAWYAVRAVLRTTATAEDRGELDLVLALPLPRTALLAGAFAAAAVGTGVLLALTWALTMGGSVAAGTGLEAAPLAAGVLGLWPLAMVAAGTALLATGLLHGASRAGGIAAAALVAGYAATSSDGSTPTSPTSACCQPSGGTARRCSTGLTSRRRWASPPRRSRRRLRGRSCSGAGTSVPLPR